MCESASVTDVVWNNVWISTWLQTPFEWERRKKVSRKNYREV